jgi:flagellar basal-body rod protein FlgG
MSIQTLYTAASGMESLQTKLDVIANNLANVNTTGFKKGRANFEDNFYRHYKYPGSQDSQGNLTGTGTSIGLGSRVQSVQTSQQQGASQQTNGLYDMSIEGQGYFQVQDPSGQTLYTRAGNFSLNAPPRWGGNCFPTSLCRPVRLISTLVTMARCRMCSMALKTN